MFEATLTGEDTTVEFKRPVERLGVVVVERLVVEKELVMELKEDSNVWIREWDASVTLLEINV